MKQKRQDNRATVYIICFLLLIIVGIYFAALTSIRIENYQNPFRFILIFGTLGLIFGYIIARKLKPFIQKHPKELATYSIHKIFWVLIFVPYFSFVGAIVNNNLSEIDLCNEYSVINKIRKKRIRATEINQLIVDINGRPVGLYCSHDYLDKTKYGDSINICFYISKIGFDFMNITNDKK